MLREVVHVVVHLAQGFVGDGHGCARCIEHFAFKHIVHNSILDDLTVDIELRDERTGSECLEHGITGRTHTALDGQEALGDATGLDVAREEFCYVQTNLQCFGIHIGEGACLFGDVALNDSHNLLGGNADIVLSKPVIRFEHHDGTAVLPAVGRLVGIVQILGVGVVELVVFKDDVFCQACNGGDDTSCRRQVCAAFLVAFHHIADFDDGPVDLSIEPVAESLCHVSEVHVLVVHLSQVGVSAEILVRGEGCAEFDGFSYGHISFYALAGGSSGKDSYLEFLALFVQSDGTLREFTEDGLGVGVRCKARECHSITVVYQFCSFCR